MKLFFTHKGVNGTVITIIDLHQWDITSEGGFFMSDDSNVKPRRLSISNMCKLQWTSCPLPKE